MDTSQSNSAYTINDSSVGDDDVNDIIELEKEIEKGLRLVEQKAPRQRKLTSQVWSLFRGISIRTTSRERCVKNAALSTWLCAILVQVI